MGVSGLELPSRKYESCVTSSNSIIEMLFRFRSWIEKHFSLTKESTSQESTQNSDLQRRSFIAKECAQANAKVMEKML